MKQYSISKELPFNKELKGISQKTIDIHYGKLYQGYVKKWQEVEEALKNADSSKANASFSDFRELKLEQGFLADAILLHEAYFDILGLPAGASAKEGGGGGPKGDILKAIEQDFGNFEKWEQDFKACGLSARGWVILAYDFNDGKLRNYVADTHNQGGVWGTAPVIVLDVYEHAYFIDYGSDRKSYIDAYFQNLNWDKINNKFNKIK